MSCECKTEAEEVQQKGTLIALLLINAAMFGAEIVCGIIADSTGLIADSLDMLADALVYGISLCAVGRSALGRARAAHWSGIFQIILAACVATDIVRRFIYGSEPDSVFMYVVGAVALAANITCLRLIYRHRRGQVHMRASWIFSKNDVLANLGVIIAGILVHFTGTRWPDIVIGLMITVIVLRGGIEILRDAAAERGAEG